jgi:hypothetical protein
MFFCRSCDKNCIACSSKKLRKKYYKNCLSKKKEVLSLCLSGAKGRARLFTVISVLVALAVVADDGAAAAVREAALALLHLLDDARAVAAAAAERRAVLGTAALAALGERAERRRLLEIEQILEVGIGALENAKRVASIEACSNRHDSFSLLSLRGSS